MKEKRMTKLAKPMLFAAAIIWGTSFFVMKNALDVMPIYSLLAIRFTAAAALLSIVFAGKWKHFTIDYLWRGATIGAFLFGAYLIQTMGLAHTTPSKNAFLTAVYCVMVPFFSWLVVHKRPDRYNMIAALLCVAGIGLVSLNAGEMAEGLNAGDMLTLCGAVFYAVHIVAVDKVSPGKDIYLLTVLQFAFAALYAWVGSLCVETLPLSLMATPAVYFPLVYPVLCPPRWHYCSRTWVSLGQILSRPV